MYCSVIFFPGKNSETEIPPPPTKGFVYTHEIQHAHCITMQNNWAAKFQESLGLAQRKRLHRSHSTVYNFHNTKAVWKTKQTLVQLVNGPKDTLPILLHKQCLLGPAIWKRTAVSFSFIPANVESTSSSLLRPWLSTKLCILDLTSSLAVAAISKWAWSSWKSEPWGFDHDR
jgi:hypothetical protein